MATNTLQSKTGIIPIIMEWSGTTISTNSFTGLAFSDAVNLDQLIAKMAQGIDYTVDISAPLAITAAGAYYGMWVKNDASFNASNISSCVARVRAIGANATVQKISVPIMLIPVRMS